MSRARQPSAPLVLLFTAIMLGACGPQESGGPGSGDAAAAAPAPPASTPPAPAGGGSVTPEEIRAHRLSLDRLRAIYQAELEWKRAGGQMDEETDTEAGDDMSAAAGANGVLRQIQSQPALVAALRRAGVSPRQAAVEMMVFGVASIAAASGHPTYTSQVAPENIEFVRTHKAELARLEEAKEAAEEPSEQ